MISVGGFVLIIVYFICFVCFFSLGRLKRFKWIMFNASIIISIFFALGTAIASFSYIELSVLLYVFTAIVTMVVNRKSTVDKRALISMAVLVIIMLLSLLNLAVNDNMPDVVLMETRIDDVFMGTGRIEKAAFTSSNLYHLRMFLLMIVGLLLSTDFLKSGEYLERTLNVIKKSFYVFFVFVTVEFILNNAGYVEELRGFVLSLAGNYDESKVYIAQNRFGYYGVTAFFSEQSYVSLMIIFLCISYVKGLHSSSEILWYVYSIAVILMFGCTTSLMLVPFALFIYIKEIILPKTKSSNKVTFYKFAVLITTICISVYIVSKNFTALSETAVETVSKLSAYLIGGKYHTAGENSAAIRYLGNQIVLKAFWASPILGVGIGTTRGYGIIPGFLANFGLLGGTAYFIFLNKIFNFSIKKKILLLVIMLAYFSTILTVWYIYYFALIPIYISFSKHLGDNKCKEKESAL